MLNPSNNFSENDFVQQLIDLQNFLTDNAEPGSIHEKIKAIPQAETVSDLWILTSSGQSALVAAHFGMALSFAHFINPTGGPQAIRAYHKRFKPSERFPKPEASVGIFVNCADTEEKANEMQAVMDWQLLNIERGAREGFPAFEDIKSHRYSHAELERIQTNRGRMISGTPEQVKAALEILAYQYDVEEIVVATITHDFADCLRSYALLAEAFELIASPTATVVDSSAKATS